MLKNHFFIEPKINKNENWFKPPNKALTDFKII